MKRFLLSLVALVVTSVCFAQDVIIQKDGSTIQAKVLKVSQSEVEYKKFNNPDGPTYTISTKDLQCINYENGTKDTFVSPNYNPNIMTNETATQFSNDQQLLALYNAKRPFTQKKARKLNTIAWVGAPIIAAGTFVLAGVLPYSNSHSGNTSYYYYGAIAGLGTGTAWYFIFNNAAKRAERKSELSIQSVPVYQQEFKVGKNDRLMVGVDVLKDNTRKNQTLGLGVSYNF